MRPVFDFGVSKGVVPSAVEFIFVGIELEDVDEVDKANEEVTTAVLEITAVLVERIGVE